MQQKAGVWILCALALGAGAASAQQQEAPPPEEASSQGEAASADEAPPPETAEEGAISEVIVVTASRTEQPLHEAPATVSVLTAADIADIPADDYGDLLRNIPGVNVTQTSARDINLTARGSTNTLSTSQLVLLDGRSIYLDFFGFVMWDFLPVNTNEIKQIEMVRGPGSAVWGANAMTGVVNLITKRPKEIVGTSVLLGGGELGTLFGSISHAGVSGNLGYKVSAGYYEQDAYERPVFAGIPTFENQGTEQPKADLRLDWDVTDGAVFSLGGGYAGTDGVIHTGIGPFDIDQGSNLAYAKADWTRQALRVSVFANSLSADSVNLVSRGVNGLPLGFEFATDTYNLEVSNTSVVGESNILTYGGNFRQSDFELEIAPQGTEKDEWGVFLQDEILFGDKVRWVIGGRYDEIDPLEDGVFTPRTSLGFSPSRNHTFRISYNEAFRTPSVINNYLDASILVGPPSGAFVVPARAQGPALLGVDLVEEHMTAYEVGWVGTFANGLNATLNVYRNEIEDTIDFFTAATYGGTNIPAFILPPTLPQTLRFCFALAPTPLPLAPAQFRGCPPVAVVGGVPIVGFGGLFPSNFSYRNIGQQTDQGVELSLQQRRRDWSWFFNASWQDDPEFEGLVDPTTQNLPPEWRANAGVGYDVGRWFANANVNYQDEAFWGDVDLGPSTKGFTDSFTMVNVALGVRLMNEALTLQVTGANVFDEDVQQHFFGDIISRKVTGQVGFRF